MESISLKFSVAQIFSIVEQLPKEAKVVLFKKLEKEFYSGGSSPEKLNVEGYDAPFDLNAAELRPRDLEKLQVLWKNEPKAEVLTQMLTP